MMKCTIKLENIQWLKVLWLMLAAIIITGCDRYTVSSEKVITDRKTGLQWLIGSSGTWDMADDWASSLQVDGGGWRLPSLKELETIYYDDRKQAVFADGKVNIEPIFLTTGNFFETAALIVWSNEYCNNSIRFHRVFNFRSSGTICIEDGYRFHYCAFAVRSRN